MLIDKYLGTGVFLKMYDLKHYIYFIVEAIKM